MVKKYSVGTFSVRGTLNVGGKFSLGTLNVRGLREEQKRGHLAADIDSYKLDVLCIQETKIKEGIDCNIGKHRLIAFDAENTHHGVGFVVANKWRENLHKLWKVSHRIAVMQLCTKPPDYESSQIDDNAGLSFVRKVNYRSQIIKRKQPNKVSYDCQQISDTKILVRKIKKTRNKQTPAKIRIKLI